MGLDVDATFLNRWSTLGRDVLESGRADNADEAVETVEPLGAEAAVDVVNAERRWSTLGRLLLDHHSEQLRRYHGSRHVLAVLDVLATLDPERSRQPALRLAAFFHDAVYDPTASDNEERSATMAEEELARFSIDERVIASTARLIRATDGHRPDGSDDVALFLDADLAILGTAGAAYDEYAMAIRHEYGHLPDDAFRAGRTAVLQLFLDRPQLYFTAAGHARFEAPARANVRREIAQLTSALESRSMTDNEETADNAAATTIKIRENGPLLVSGPITLTDHEGTPVACDGDTIALCRCGLSSKKPFCDGTHRGEFDGTLAAADD